VARVRTPRLDVTSGWMADRFGGIDLLVNFAGVRRSRALEATLDSDLAEEIGLNFMGTARMTRTALPFLRQSREGAIVLPSLTA